MFATPEKFCLLYVFTIALVSAIPYLCRAPTFIDIFPVFPALPIHPITIFSSAISEQAHIALAHSHFSQGAKSEDLAMCETHCGVYTGGVRSTV